MSYVALGTDGFGIEFFCAPNMVKDPSGKFGCRCIAGFQCTTPLNVDGNCTGDCVAVAKEPVDPSATLAEKFCVASGHVWFQGACWDPVQLAQQTCVEAGGTWDPSTFNCLGAPMPVPVPTPTPRVPGPVPGPVPTPIPQPAGSQPPPLVVQPAGTLSAGEGLALGLIASGALLAVVLLGSRRASA